MKKIVFLFFTIILISCKSTQLDFKKSPILLDISKETDDNAIVNLKNYSNDFVFDMKYATDDNFLKEKLYPCAECFLRVKTVKSLLEANKAFSQKGYKIKLFDCYRPKAIQKKMFKIVPDPNFVANPKKGSIHNRGGAVDISLVDSLGVEVNMGTKFDFFGEEASHNYQNLSDGILVNRRLLKEIMLQHNFKSFDSEWWHYNLKGSNNDEVSNKKWRCEN
jgi:D-alanyl-D-alanine dipeptidase